MHQLSTLKILLIINQRVYDKGVTNKEMSFKRMIFFKERKFYEDKLSKDF